MRDAAMRDAAMKQARTRKKTRPMVGQGTQGQMVGNKQLDPTRISSPSVAPLATAAQAQRLAQTQNMQPGAYSRGVTTPTPSPAPTIDGDIRTGLIAGLAGAPGVIADNYFNKTTPQKQMHSRRPILDTYKMPGGMTMPNTAMSPPLPPGSRIQAPRLPAGYTPNTAMSPPLPPGSRKRAPQQPPGSGMTY